MQVTAKQCGLLLGASIIGFASVPALAEDECATALVAADGTFDGSLDNNTGATGDDSSCGNAGGGIDTIDEWWAYTAERSGTLFVSTCSTVTDFDTTLAVFDGCGGTELACNDDTPGNSPVCNENGGSLLSTVTLPITEGETYYVRVSVWNDSFGVFDGREYQVTFVGPTPTSEECDGGESTGPARYTSWFGERTGASGDDSSCGNAGGGVDTIDEWWVYRSVGAGTLSVSTCHPGTEFDTLLSAYDACKGVELACNDDSNGPGCSLRGPDRKSTIDVEVTAGQLVYIRVSVWDDSFGSQDRRVYEITFDGPEANNNCDTLGDPVGEGTYPGSIANNSGDGDDDSCGGANTIDEWWAYTAEGTGTLHVNTCNPGTLFDTTLSAFDACDGNEIACNDDDPDATPECVLSGQGVRSVISFAITAGETYYVRVSVWDDTFAPGFDGRDYEITFVEDSVIPVDCPCERDGDPSAVLISDLIVFLGLWFAEEGGPPVDGPGTGADVDGDNEVDVADLITFLGCWFDANGGPCLQ